LFKSKSAVKVLADPVREVELDVNVIGLPLMVPDPTYGFVIGTVHGVVDQPGVEITVDSTSSSFKISKASSNVRELSFIKRDSIATF
jgi:hypothetical protein